MDRTSYIREHHARFGVGAAHAIAAIADATAQPVDRIERIVRGDEYEVYRAEISDRSVVYLRVAWPDAPQQKLRHEAMAMGRARDAGVPVPDVLGLGSIASDDGLRPTMVLRESAGHQLAALLPDLDHDQRVIVMRGVGGVLRQLHSVAMPGAGVPNADDEWLDPASKRQRYLGNVLSDTGHLAAAGFRHAEVDQIRAIVQTPIVPLEDPPVLCHGDLSSEHIFVDDELRVTGLIDWGMWYAGSAASELAGLRAIHSDEDVEQVILGHGFEIDDTAQDQLDWHTVTQSVGAIRWLVVSGQFEELARPRGLVRDAVRRLHD